MDRIEQEKLYYSNKDGRGARVSRDLVDRLFVELGRRLRSDEVMDFFEQTRTPCERELYGLFVLALHAATDGQIGHVSTEFQVGRGESKGRVDLLFRYRETTFLVEFKMGRLTPRDVGSEISHTNVKKPWYLMTSTGAKGVVAQLEELDTSDLPRSWTTRMVKLPIVLYIYRDFSALPVENWQGRAEDAHKFLMEQLEQGPQPLFEYRSVFSQPLRTRRRTTAVLNDDDYSVYGFSLVGGYAAGMLT